MLLKFLYVLFGTDIILALLRIKESGFGEASWPIIFSTVFVAVAIIIRERE